MGVALSSQVYSVTFTASSRAALVDAISDAMVQGGWSRTGSSGDWYLTNGTHPSGFSATVRVWDLGSGDYIGISMTSPLQLDQNWSPRMRVVAGDYRIIVCPNQVMCYHIPTFATHDGRKWILTIPWSPPDFVAFSPATTLIFLCSADRFGTSNVSSPFTLADSNNGLYLGAGQCAFLPGFTNSSSPAGHVRFPNECNRPAKWAKDVLYAEAARLSLYDPTSEPRTVGYLWDAFLVASSSAVLEEVWTYDGHNYMCVAYSGGSNIRLFLRVS